VSGSSHPLVKYGWRVKPVSDPNNEVAHGSERRKEE
jgi:hypothetical protein